MNDFKSNFFILDKDNLIILNELFKSIERRSGMYIKEQKISLLEAYLNGYFSECYIQCFGFNPNIYLVNFKLWMKNKNRIRNFYETMNWAATIKLIENDEYKGFLLFFELWRDFYREQFSDFESTDSTK